MVCWFGCLVVLFVLVCWMLVGLVFAVLVGLVVLVVGVFCLWVV